MALPAVMSDPPMALLASSICEAGFPEPLALMHNSRRRLGEMLLATTHAAALQGGATQWPIRPATAGNDDGRCSE